MSNFFTLLEQARLGMKLTPAQRAFIRLYSNSLILALFVAAGALVTAMTAGKTIHDVIIVTITSFAFTIFSAIGHFYMTHGQPMLGSTITQIEQKMEQETHITIPQIPNDVIPTDKNIDKNTGN
jgi:hypothetical protein